MSTEPAHTTATYYWLHLDSARDWIAAHPADEQWAFTVSDGGRHVSFTLKMLEEILEARGD